MDFEDFAMIHQKGEALLLANQQLEKGGGAHDQGARDKAA